MRQSAYSGASVGNTAARSSEDAQTGATYRFADRHIGPRPEDIEQMLRFLDLASLDELVEKTVPAQIRPPDSLPTDAVDGALTEQEVLARLGTMAGQNEVYKSYIGMGYADCFTPPVILRNLLEDPRWYTPYTPYQAEVAQGRLESLLNYQTMVMEMTGMEIANASLLDEATAAAEAMSMCLSIAGSRSKTFFVAEDCHPQVIEVVRTRAEPLGVDVVVGDHRSAVFDGPLMGALVSYPATDGTIHDYRSFVEKVHAAGGLTVVSADILALALITPPAEFGADIAVGSTQRFGVPLGYGGPHAAYLATRNAFKRHIPGRIVGVSRDAEGRYAVRLALQTREQHIRRDRATSNICTAQALLANVAAMFAVYHGPEGIREIARSVHRRAALLAHGLKRLGYPLADAPFFDTVRVPLGDHSLDTILDRAKARRLNLRILDQNTVCAALDETTTDGNIEILLDVFAAPDSSSRRIEDLPDGPLPCETPDLARTSPYLTHPIFNSFHSETEMLRYLNRLANKDLSLATSMIPLGSCTMKLNATAEMIPVTWPGFGRLHPFAPVEQARGYQTLIHELEAMLADITGFAAVSLQPNAGSQGEYAGLLVIRSYHRDRGEGHRNVCLIPQSAHGTNPASAAMASMRIAIVKTDEGGNIDVEDLRARADEHRHDLAALMITYPSTHGVFEESITEICDIVHRCGGQVYMDGANVNAQVGLCRPGDFGPDVCHLNLHKTFCIPHGGGGPGMGPLCAAAHLAPYLPSHPIVPTGGPKGIGAISAAPWGSPSILPISYAYIAMMGSEGLRRASQVAILNANYVAKRLDPYFPVLYKGRLGFVAHECIIDLRPLKAAGIEVDDVAKRLVDYGFHAPTVSWPVSGTMMIEPTESESREELDRYCDAMISIRQEVAEVESGSADGTDNVLKNAPHTAQHVLRDDWNHPYSREKAAFPGRWTRENKYWPPVARIDSAYGDRNVICACPPLEAYD